MKQRILKLLPLLVYAIISTAISGLILKFCFKDDYVGWVWLVLFFAFSLIFASLFLYLTKFKKRGK